jgi:hypothetical protein
MSIQIVNLEYKSDTGGVITVEWAATKTDGPFSHTVSGVIDLTPNPQDPSFVPINQLTPDIVTTWIREYVIDGEKLGDMIDAGLDAGIEKKKKAEVISGLPWA